MLPGADGFPFPVFPEFPGSIIGAEGNLPAAVGPEAFSAAGTIAGAVTEDHTVFPHAVHIIFL